MSTALVRLVPAHWHACLIEQSGQSQVKEDDTDYGGNQQLSRRQEYCHNLVPSKTTWRGDAGDITRTKHSHLRWLQHNGVSKHRQLDYSFNSLIRLTTTKIPKLHITGPLWWEFTGNRWIPFTKGQWCGIRIHGINRTSFCLRDPLRNKNEGHKNGWSHWLLGSNCWHGRLSEQQRSTPSVAIMLWKCQPFCFSVQFKDTEI